MQRSDILAEADKCITQDRAKTYGGAEDSFGAIADLWNWWLRGKISTGGGDDVRITPHDVSMMLALLKVARIRGNPSHRDSYVDLCGYAAIAGEMGVAPAKPEPEFPGGIDRNPSPIWRRNCVVDPANPS